MMLPNPQSPAISCASPRKLDQSYDVSWALGLDRYIAFPCQSFRELSVKGAVCGGFDVGTYFPLGLSFHDRCESAGTLLWFNAEAGLSWLLACFQLVFLAVKVELREHKK